MPSRARNRTKWATTSQRRARNGMPAILCDKEGFPLKVGDVTFGQETGYAYTVMSEVQFQKSCALDPLWHEKELTHGPAMGYYCRRNAGYPDGFCAPQHTRLSGEVQKTRVKDKEELHARGAI